MVIKHGGDIPSKDITDESAYMNRRMFLRGGLWVGAVAATAGAYYALTGGARKAISANNLESLAATAPASESLSATSQAAVDERVKSGFITKEAKTPFESIAGYNNFYEFSTDKAEVAELAQNFVSKPWQLRVEGLVGKPKTFDLDDLKKLGLEDRIYRHRCVEAWSMVIPWLGFSLASLLRVVEPREDARFVRFVTLQDPKRFPNQKPDVLPWPYQEGLRIDEAMHPLAILAMGLYGKTLPPQNGAPVRLVVPWKYGFKGIKSIVKIELVKDEPVSTWNQTNADEYGFYSNVNPDVPHPRWSQDTERRFNKDGDIDRIPTQKFNGYGPQVAYLYAGMDLKKNF